MLRAPTAYRCEGFARVTGWDEGPVALRSGTVCAPESAVGWLLERAYGPAAQLGRPAVDVVAHLRRGESHRALRGLGPGRTYCLEMYEDDVTYVFLLRPGTAAVRRQAA